MTTWMDRLQADPLPWLLAEDAPVVRHLALRQLLDPPADDPQVVQASQAAMRSAPIAGFLAAQDPAGWWAAPGAGYGPKYASTVWTLIFLNQLGADGRDERIRRGCTYLLEHAQTNSGGFGAVAKGNARPAPSTVIHWSGMTRILSCSARRRTWWLSRSACASGRSPSRAPAGRPIPGSARTSPTHLRELAKRGVHDLVVCPVGFVADHLEVLYDIDIEAQAVARELGLTVERARSMNDDPTFIAGIADVLQRRLAPAPATEAAAAG